MEMRGEHVFETASTMASISAATFSRGMPTIRPVSFSTPNSNRPPRPLANATTVLTNFSESFGRASLNSSEAFSPCAICSINVMPT